MRRHLPLLMTLLLAAPAWSHGAPTNGFVPGGSIDCSSARTFCVGSVGSEYSIICGATKTSPTSDCIAGSAIDAIKDAGNFGPSNPWTLVIGEGIWDEVLVFDNMSWGEVRNYGHIIPTVAASTDVAGGTVRFGTVTATERNTHHISWYGNGGGSSVVNDAFSGPESAMQIGPEACASVATWDHITVWNETIIGHHDAFQGCGDVQATCDAESPKLSLYDSRAIGGRDNIATKGCVDLLVSGTEILTDTAYCESTDTTHLAVVSGNSPASGGSATQLFIEDADGAVPQGFYSGRRVDVTNCAAAGTSFISGSYASIVPNGDELVLAVPLPATPDDTCDYSIAAVPENDTPECTRVDWSTLVTPNGGWWKVTGVHDSGFSPTITDPGGDRIRIVNSSVDVVVRDFGPLSNYGCAGQGHVAGYLQYTSTASLRYSGPVTISNTPITVRVLSDLVDSQTCATGLAAIQHAGSSQANEPITFIGAPILVDNVGDTDVNTYGVAGFSTETGTIVVDNATIEINLPGGYTGASAHLYQSDDSSLDLGLLSSPDQIRLVQDSATDQVTWRQGQATLGPYGDSYALVSSASLAWASGDLYCTKTMVSRGTDRLTTTRFKVGTPVAAGLASVCVYTADGQALLLKSESIDVSGSGVKTGAASASTTLPPGEYWMCLGANAAATLTINGRAFNDPPATVAGKLTTGAATCPATIAPGSIAAVAGTAIPEPIWAP